MGTTLLSHRFLLYLTSSSCFLWCNSEACSQTDRRSCINWQSRLPSPPWICLHSFPFYRYYHRFCFDEIKSIIPPKASFARNTRFCKIQHPYALKLDTDHTNAFANSFVPMTSRDWNSLPLTIFPVTLTFSLSRPASTDTFDNDPIPKSLLIFTMQRPTTDHRGCTFLAQRLLVSISL